MHRSLEAVSVVAGRAGGDRQQRLSPVTRFSRPLASPPQRVRQGPAPLSSGTESHHGHRSPPLAEQELTGSRSESLVRVDASRACDTYPNTEPPLCESLRRLRGHPEVRVV